MSQLSFTMVGGTPILILVLFLFHVQVKRFYFSKLKSNTLSVFLQVSVQVKEYINVPLFKDDWITTEITKNEMKVNVFANVFSNVYTIFKLEKHTTVTTIKMLF